MPDPTDRQRERERMVRQQIEARGVRDAAVLEAMRAVPREQFVPAELVHEAYEDNALSLARGQTISQPYVVAWMLAALRLTAQARVLEVGTGWGYSAAVLARIVSEVHTLERDPVLAQEALRRLARLGVQNVRVHVCDGSLGWPQGAPYDAIVVTAAGPALPPALLEQLAPGGRMVMPVQHEPGGQELVRVQRTGEHEVQRESLGAVRFVPLVGEQGWDSASRSGS